MKPGFWVSWRHLGSLKKARFATAEERAVFVQTWLRDGKPALWETNSRGQRIIRMERNESTDPGQPGREGDNMNMQEMIYKKGRIPPVRLADGVYRGVPFYVLSLGTHPCAYVDIAPLGLHAINERDIDCHGGITYHRDYLTTVDHKGNFLGWDYAHCMDYSGDLQFLDLGYSKRWTTKEMVAECKNVIDQIVGRTDNG